MECSKPECTNYIAEDLCAVSSNRPERQCHSDERGDCARFAPIDPVRPKPKTSITLDVP